MDADDFVSEGASGSILEAPEISLDAAPPLIVEAPAMALDETIPAFEAPAMPIAVADAVSEEMPLILEAESTADALIDNTPQEDLPPIAETDEAPRDESPYPPGEWALPAEESDRIAAETQAQLDAAAEALADNVESFQPDTWAQMSAEQRLETMQTVENEMALIQGREPLMIRTEAMDEATFGSFDGRTIAVNQDHLAGADKPPLEFLDTVLHEGRHAYQQQLQQDGDQTGLPTLGALFQNNAENYIQGADDPEGYTNQPVESDARRYAGQLTERLLGTK